MGLASDTWHTGGAAFLELVRPPSFAAEVRGESTVYRVAHHAWVNLRARWIVTALVDRKIREEVERWKTRQGIEVAVLVQLEGDGQPVAAQAIYRRPAVPIEATPQEPTEIDK